MKQIERIYAGLDRSGDFLTLDGDDFFKNISHVERVPAGYF